jgi:hypothetical protein
VKWTRRFLFLKNMGWKPAPDVTAMDIFKIQNVTLVQIVGGLGSLKEKQNRTQRFSKGKIIGIGALNDRIVE